MKKRFVFLCVRVYPDGDRRETVRTLEGMIDWLKFNREYRPGNALFVNGVRPHSTDSGYLSEKECRAVKEILTREYKKRVDDLVPKGPGLEIEFFANGSHEYFGYGEDAERPRFRLGRVA